MCQIYQTITRSALQTVRFTSVQKPEYSDDAFKKRGAAFELQYIRKQMYEQFKKIRNQLMRRREETIQKKVKDEFEKQKSDDEKKNKFVTLNNFIFYLKLNPGYKKYSTGYFTKIVNTYQELPTSVNKECSNKSCF